MKRLVVTEHTRIERRRDTSHSTAADVVSLESHHYDRVRAHDRLDRDDRDRIFDWSDGYARTTQWVGVVHVPGVQIEILPKIDAPVPVTAEKTEFEARRNLLFMLALSGDIPVRSRDIARLSVRRAPLSETLIAIFASRLRDELLLGPERAYQEQEENLRTFKGKLAIPRHVLHNAAHRERFYCRYNNFSEDTVMNRIFRASCHTLLALTTTPATQDLLRHCLLLLEGVEDVTVQDSDFDRISIDRNRERFEELLRFCRLLLAGKTSTIQAGQTRTFSLLFDMNKVFERFVSAFLRRYVLPRLQDVALFPQAARHTRHLMQSDGAGILRLQPDLLLESATRRLVMDTKWKLLSPGRRGRGGVSEADLYQLYAYTRRFGCTRTVLLYPYTSGLTPRTFSVLDDLGKTTGEEVLVRHLVLQRNLQHESEREALASELEAIVREGFGERVANASLGGAA